MSKPPPIPIEQRSFAAGAAQAEAEGHERLEDLEKGHQPGNAGVNLDTQGRYGNARQNLRPQWKTQGR